jgi:hypothetical protein
MLAPGSLRWNVEDVSKWIDWRNELGRLHDAGIDGDYMASPKFSVPETATEKNPKVSR